VVSLITGAIGISMDWDVVIKPGMLGAVSPHELMIVAWVFFGLWMIATSAVLHRALKR
jgi:hypothetical protein